MSDGVALAGMVESAVVVLDIEALMEEVDADEEGSDGDDDGDADAEDEEDEDCEATFAVGGDDVDDVSLDGALFVLCNATGSGGCASHTPPRRRPGVGTLSEVSAPTLDDEFVGVGVLFVTSAFVADGVGAE